MGPYFHDWRLEEGSGSKRFSRNPKFWINYLLFGLLDLVRCSFVWARYNGEEFWGGAVVSAFWRLFPALSLVLIKGIHNFIIANSTWIGGKLRMPGTE